MTQKAQNKTTHLTHYLNGVNMERIEGYKERIVQVDGDTAQCSGDNNDHPLVYIKVPHEGYAVCNYCDIKFERKQQ